MKKKQWYVVTGRIPFDDEDSAQAFLAANSTEAYGKFATWIKEESSIEKWTEDNQPIVNYIIKCGATKPKIENI